MDADALEDHWQRLWTRKAPDQVTWFQPVPAVSLDLVERIGLDPLDPIIDAGAGASLFVDRLLDLGFADVTVLDVSSKAIALAKERLGERSHDVTWLCEDITSWIPDRCFRLWHDRAVFHFLTDPVDRALYAAVLYEALEPGGYAAIGTFAPEGPSKCSGLPVCRHDAASLQMEFGPAFELVHEERERHVSPGGVEQIFAWSLFRRI